MNELGTISAKLKTGEEPLKSNGKNIGVKLVDFWKWSVSDLLSNATRGRLAEFIVGSAIGCDFNKVRDEWADCDLITPSGIRLEIKSSSYIQSWQQSKYSKIIFSIKKSVTWNGETGEYRGEKTRPSDFYIFCLLRHLDQNTIDPLDLNQWSFYVLPTSILNEKFNESSTISLSVLEKLISPIHYDDLKKTIEK